jgi:hypothetical protein
VSYGIGPHDPDCTCWRCQSRKAQPFIKAKARNLIPGWPRGRSTLGPLWWEDGKRCLTDSVRHRLPDCEEVFCCRSMAYSIFPIGSMEEMRTLDWMRVVPIQTGGEYRLALANAAEEPLCEITFCPWCGDRVGEMVEIILRMLNHSQTRDYHEGQQKMLDDWRVEQFRIDQFVAAGGGADITREQYDRMFPNGTRYLRSCTHTMLAAARETVQALQVFDGKAIPTTISKAWLPGDEEWLPGDL